LAARLRARRLAHDADAEPAGGDPLDMIQGVLLDEEGAGVDSAAAKTTLDDLHRSASQRGAADPGALATLQACMGAGPLAPAQERGDAIKDSAGSGGVLGPSTLAGRARELARQQLGIEARAAAAWGCMCVAAC